MQKHDIRKITKQELLKIYPTLKPEDVPSVVFYSPATDLYWGTGYTEDEMNRDIEEVLSRKPTELETEMQSAGQQSIQQPVQQPAQQPVQQPVQQPDTFNDQLNQQIQAIQSIQPIDRSRYRRFGVGQNQITGGNEAEVEGNDIVRGRVRDKRTGREFEGVINKEARTVIDDNGTVFSFDEVEPVDENIQSVDFGGGHVITAGVEEQTGQSDRPATQPVEFPDRPTSVAQRPAMAQTQPRQTNPPPVQEQTPVLPESPQQQQHEITQPEDAFSDARAATQGDRSARLKRLSDMFLRMLIQQFGTDDPDQAAEKIGQMSPEKKKLFEKMLENYNVELNRIPADVEGPATLTENLEKIEDSDLSPFMKYLAKMGERMSWASPAKKESFKNDLEKWRVQMQYGGSEKNWNALAQMSKVMGDLVDEGRGASKEKQKNILGMAKVILEAESQAARIEDRQTGRKIEVAAKSDKSSLNWMKHNFERAKANNEISQKEYDRGMEALKFFQEIERRNVDTQNRATRDNTAILNEQAEAQERTDQFNIQQQQRYEHDQDDYNARLYGEDNKKAISLNAQNNFLQQLEDTEEERRFRREWDIEKEDLKNERFNKNLALKAIHQATGGGHTPLSLKQIDEQIQSTLSDDALHEWQNMSPDRKKTLLKAYQYVQSKPLGEQRLLLTEYHKTREQLKKTYYDPDEDNRIRQSMRSINRLIAVGDMPSLFNAVTFFRKNVIGDTGNQAYSEVAMSMPQNIRFQAQALIDYISGRAKVHNKITNEVRKRTTSMVNSVYNAYKHQAFENIKALNSRERGYREFTTSVFGDIRKELTDSFLRFHPQYKRRIKAEGRATQLRRERSNTSAPLPPTSNEEVNELDEAIGE